MVRDPTYSNFQLVHGRRDDENVYSNCCNHQRRNEAHRARRGWKGDITCGGWTILCGKTCILYFVIATIFLTILILLVASLVNNVSLRTSMTRTLPNLTEKHEEIRSLATNMTDMLTKLTKKENDNASLAIMTRLNDMLTNLTEKHEEIRSLATNISDMLTNLTKKENDISSLGKNVSDVQFVLNRAEKEFSELKELVKMMAKPNKVDKQAAHNMRSDVNCSCSEEESHCLSKKWMKAELEEICGKKQECPNTKDISTQETVTHHETTSVSDATTPLTARQTVNTPVLSTAQKNQH